MAEAARALGPPSEDHDHIVVLHNTTWADYERMLEVRATYPRRGSASWRGPSSS